jgi:hypothetical protein
METLVVHARLQPATFTLIEHISKHTGIKKSMLIRAAITQWLQNAPENLPLDLKIEITRSNIDHEINTAKNLRWTYHKAREAHLHLQELKHLEFLPPHAQETIKQIENNILTLQNQLDQWIKERYQTGGTTT